jgi:CubicO group peptidase (beta-lactamase class C family)
MVQTILVREGRIERGAGETADVPWWSFTKTVIAAACLALVRNGRLDLDGALTGRTFTLRQLLQHRAGLRDYGAVPAYHEAVARRESSWPAKVMLERSQAEVPLYPAGEGWSYSNIGYYFVRRLIEDSTGITLAAALQDLVLAPLGIEHVRLASGRGVLAPDYDSAWVYHGSLIGPLPQAALLLDRLLSGMLLGQALTQTMLERCTVPGGRDPERPWVSPGYGLGLMIGTVANGLQLAGHTGGGPGCVVAVYRDVKSGRGTAAAFRTDANQGAVERACLATLA